MSSENPVKKAAIKLGEQEFRKAFGAGGGSSAGAGAPAPGLGAVANEGASSAADLARQVAGIMLRAAIGIGEQVVDAAGKLESVVGDQPAAGSTYEPRADDTTPREPVALMLPPVSPGGATSKRFDVRNASLATIDAMTVRCDGLFARGGSRIPGTRIRFTPPTVDVAPHGTAEVECTVDVPAAATRGTYTGLIETDRTGVQLLVSLTVV
jgi:hypothetical protein